MNKAGFCALLLACIDFNSASALDLTPKMIQIPQGARMLLRPYFLDGQTRYGIQLPASTLIYAEPGEAHFTFFDAGGASMVLKSSPEKPSRSFEEADLEVYRKLALAQAPAGATAIALRKEVSNAHPAQEWTSYRFIVDCLYWGSRLRQSVTFVNLNSKDQLLAVTTADAGQFELALGKSVQILNSFHPLAPEEDLSAPVYP